MACNEFGHRLGCDSQRGGPASPVESRRHGRQIIEVKKVVGQIGIATTHHIPVCGRQFGLQRYDLARALDVLVGRSTENQREHRRDMDWVGTEYRGMLIVAVVGLVGQS